MIVEERTGEFKRFDGSWRHQANWCFLLIVIGHVYFSGVWIYFSWFHLTSYESQFFTTVHLVAFMLFFATLLTLLKIPLIFIFFCRHLQTAAEILNHYDHKLSAIHSGFCYDRQRMYVGIAITVIVLVIANITTINLFYNTQAVVGIAQASLNQLLLNFKISQLFTWFLLLHLSYYSISYRICNLTTFIETQNAQYPINDTGNEQSVAIVLAATAPNQRTKALRNCGYLFDQICQAAHEINLTFSFSILLILALIMVFCSTCLFLFINVMAELVEHPSIRIFFYVFPAGFTLGLMITVVILASVNNPTKQLERVCEKIIEISTEDDLEISVLNEAILLNTNLSADSAGGLFTVGTHLIPVWVNTVITYLVIFIQSTSLKRNTNVKGH